QMESNIDLIIDIEPGEAEKLIKLIELILKESYITRYERDLLLNEIISIGDDKEKQRNGD
ncbi:MAG: hypothetical protein RR585_14890, partial [Coprobacillus sp.]